MMWVWMSVWMVVFWALVIGGVIWLINSISRRNRGQDATGRLELRLANGEIDVEEFERRKAALREEGVVAGSRGYWLAGVIALVIAVLVVMPVVAMAADGWNMDMWNMHGRGENTSSDTVVQGGNAARVSIQDFAFEPGNLEVPVGATVTWTNDDSASHDATARNGEWETSRLSKGESDTVTLSSAGQYDYYCSIHPSMKARITVR